MKKTSLGLVCMGIVGLAHATSGASDYGYGIVSKGMGGTGIAQPQNAMSMAVNPANLVFIDDNMDVGFTIFSPRRSYSATNVPTPPFVGFSVAPGTYDSMSNWFFLPYIAFQKRINDRLTTGISMYGNGGMNTNYSSNIVGANFGGQPLPPGVYGGGIGLGARTGGDLKQIFINVPLSVKVNDNFSIGASFLTMAETLKLEGFSAFANPAFTTNVNYFTNQFTAVTWGFGGLFGATYRFNDRISVGGSYQMKIKPSALNAYQGTFPNAGVIESPAKASVGLSVKPTQSTVVNVDYQHIYWSDTGAFGNPFSCTTTQPCFGTPNGSGFGWNDTNLIKVGGEWYVNDDYTLRLGYAHSNNPIPANQALLNIIAPAVTQNHITVGMTRNFGEDHHLNLQFMYSPSSSMTGFNQFNPAQEITLSMKQYEFGASWTWYMDRPMPAPTK